MNWHYRKNFEVNGIVEVGYSYENNETCDGIIQYDKTTRTSTIEKISEGCSLGVAQRGARFIPMLIDEDKLTEKVFNIRTG